MTSVFKGMYQYSIRIAVLLGVTVLAYLLGLFLDGKSDSKPLPIFSLFSANIAHADVPYGGGGGETCESAGCESGESGECCF